MPGGCVIQLGVLQGAYSEVQGLVEADSSTTLDLAGSNQFMLCPQWLSFFQLLCSARFLSHSNHFYMT